MSAAVVVPVCFTLFVAGAVAIEADDFDMSTFPIGPFGAGPGGVAAIGIGYHNAGPDTAVNTYIWASIPSGVPAPVPDITPLQWDALQGSVVPDGLGNTATLYYDNRSCEHLVFQVERQMPAGTPINGLGPGVGAAVYFDLEIPMDPPGFAGLAIDAPANLAGEYKPVSGDSMWVVGSVWRRFSTGWCESAPADCSDLSTCFGPRLSATDPVIGDFELVNDGSADPTFGCLPLTGYTPGNIAVIDRGGCEFGTKAKNAQDAGATAVVFVNNGLCSGQPDSPSCVINMNGGVDGHLVTIPVLMLSVDDGQPIVAALQAATSVTGRMGAVSDSFALDSEVLLTGGDLDPDLTNNIGSIELVFGGIFMDGFESGDTGGWPIVAP